MKDEIIIYQINEIKNKIKDFIIELDKFSMCSCNSSLSQKEKDFFAFLSKQIIFLKNIYEFENKYSIKVLISDYYNYIISIVKGEHRYMYVNERSIIENYTRLVTSISVDVNYITSDVFDKLRKHPDISSKEYSLIKSEYCNSCGYIHGSKLLNNDLAYVFKECIIGYGKVRNINNYFDNIIKIIKTYNRILILSYSELIDNCFFRKKSVLKYLIGNNNVEILFRKK